MDKIELIKDIFLDETVRINNRNIISGSGMEEYCLDSLSDKQAWEVGQFLWNVQPDYDTTNRSPNFFKYRERVYAALDKRKIVHPPNILPLL